MEIKKILLISSLYPLPEDLGTRMRTMNFFRFFKNHGDVDLLYFRPSSRGADVTSPFRKEYCIRPGIEPAGSLGRDSILKLDNTRNRVKRIMERRPYIVTEWSPQSLQECISVIEREQYDMILCRYMLDTFPLFSLPKEFKKRIIIDFDDIYSEDYFKQKEGKIRGFFQRVKWMLEKSFIVGYQKKCLSFGASLFCSDVDRRKFSGKGEWKHMHVVPNTFPIRQNPNEISSNGFKNMNHFLFVGALDYRPNIEGLCWFVETIFSRIINVIGKDMKLMVVGRHPVEEIRQLCEMTPNIELHANVPDVKPFYEKCGIVVIPILSGGGTRIKILESAMAARPVVSTLFGASGLDVTDGKDLMIFNDKTSFLEKVEKLKEKEIYDAIVFNMRNIVEQKYSLKAFLEAMGQVLHSVN